MTALLQYAYIPNKKDRTRRCVLFCCYTEQLKAQDQMLWVQRMNNIRDRVMEIINHNLIYA